MSKELFDMYSEELEYVCKNLGSTCYIYVYDKTKMIDHEQGQLAEFLRLEIGLLVVYVVRKPDGQAQVYNNHKYRRVYIGDWNNQHCETHVFDVLYISIDTLEDDYFKGTAKAISMYESTMLLRGEKQ